MRKDEVYIIGGGSSLKTFHFGYLRDKDTIAVNESVYHIPNPKYFITMDYTFLNKNREKIKKLEIPKFFITAMSNPDLKYEDGRIIDSKNHLIYHLDMVDTIIYSKNERGMGTTFRDFVHGCSSGYCALQLAIVLNYQKIYLLGIDLTVTDDTHFHKSYRHFKQIFQKKLDFFFPYFVKGIREIQKKQPQIEIYSCSEISRLNKILPYKRLEYNT